MYYTPQHRAVVSVMDSRHPAVRQYGKHRRADDMHEDCPTTNCNYERGACVDAFIMWEQAQNA